MTIADTLFDAANDIRGYIEDDIVPSDKLKDEIMGIVAMMDALRAKIDARGAGNSSNQYQKEVRLHDATTPRPIVCEREFRKSQAQEETTQPKP
jgi:hypothetical protein